MSRRRGRPALLAALALVVALVLSGCGGDEAAPGPSVRTLPEVTLAGFGPDSAERVDLATLSGPLVVNLWASWCGPCAREMPVLADFDEQYGDQVSLLGINHLETQDEEAAALVAESGVTYDLLSDPEGLVSDAPPFPFIRGLPFLALVDADGTVVHMEFAVIESVEELVELVDTHLGTDL